jgi:hypothetical protein
MWTVIKRLFSSKILGWVLVGLSYSIIIAEGWWYAKIPDPLGGASLGLLPLWVGYPLWLATVLPVVAFQRRIALALLLQVPFALSVPRYLLAEFLLCDLPFPDYCFAYHGPTWYGILDLWRLWS